MQWLEWLRWLEGLISNPVTIHKLIATVVIIVVVWLVRTLLVFIANRHIEDIHIRYQWRTYSGYAAMILVIFLAGPMWFAGLQNALTYLGLLSAGLAIALQGPLVNLAGWLFIIWRRPFYVGDRVQLNNHAGDVIDLRLFQFTLLEIGNWVAADQSTGRILHVPNGKVFSEVLANYSRGFQYIWNEIPVTITFESNWKRAKQILHTVAVRHGSNVSEAAKHNVKEAARKFMIFYSKYTPTVYTDVREYGVVLTIRYLCDPRQRRGTTQAIWEDILEEFALCPDIDFAYPTQRFYHNLTEGKPETRARSVDQPYSTRNVGE